MLDFLYYTKSVLIKNSGALICNWDAVMSHASNEPTVRCTSQATIEG